MHIMLEYLRVDNLIPIIIKSELKICIVLEWSSIANGFLQRLVLITTYIVMSVVWNNIFCLLSHISSAFHRVDNFINNRLQRRNCFFYNIFFDEHTKKNAMLEHFHLQDNSGAPNRWILIVHDFTCGKHLDTGDSGTVVGGGWRECMRCARNRGWGSRKWWGRGHVGTFVCVSEGTGKRVLDAAFDLGG